MADGELAGERDEENGRWRVYQHSVHAMLPERPSRVDRLQESLEAPERVRDLEERWQALNDRIAALQHDLGRAQARAELTELAESTLREQLERERRRADQERERAEAERKRAEGLRADLEAERGKGFWRRLFGG